MTTMMRIIDPQAARTAILTRYPKNTDTPEQHIRLIAHHLQLKAQGLAHDDRTVAIYEEHAAS